MFGERLHDLWLRLMAVLKRRQLDRDLAEELEFHLTMREQKLVEQGMPPREAHYAARRGFGNAVALKERTRDQWSFPSLESLLQDVRFGLRMLARNRGSTALAVLTLALGIGGTTAIFSVVSRGFLNPFPYKDSGRLAVVVRQGLKHPVADSWVDVTAPEFLDIQEQNHVFDDVIGGFQGAMVLTSLDGTTDTFGVSGLTLNTFRVLGMAPLIGRAFAADDAKPGAPPVILLNYTTWQNRFGGDRGIVGKSIVLDDQPTTVIGVMPPRFHWYDANGWIPIVFSKNPTKDQDQTSWVIGHLKPGVTIPQASAHLALLEERLAATYPKQHPKDVTFSAESLTEARIYTPNERTMTLVLGGVGLLLLIACVNVGNLLLARAVAREQEFAIRTSLGADRLRLVRQLMVESLMLALAGGALGCFVAWNTIDKLVAIIPVGYFPLEAVIKMDSRVLGFAVGTALVSTLLFGLAPAVLLVKGDLLDPLKASGTRSGGSRRHSRLRNLLVVSEVTLSLVLLTGAGMLFRSFWSLRHAELGYSVDQVLEVSAGPLGGRYTTPEGRNQARLEELRSVRALPGVASAALGWPPVIWSARTPIEIPGHPSDETQRAFLHIASDGFFETMQIPLLQGRTISEEDLAEARNVVVVNRAFANEYFAGQSPLGRQVKVVATDLLSLSKDTPFEIVGMVADTKQSFAEELVVRPQIFLPPAVKPNGWNMLYVRGSGNPAGLVNPIRHAIGAVYKGLPTQALPLGDLFEDWYAEPRFMLGMFIGFAALGLTLICLGVYSVLSYSVALRTHEIGVRMALGAEAGDVRWWVVKAGLRWLLISVGIGIPASVALAKILQNRIWGIKGADPVTLAAVSAVMIAVGLAACYFPARRATKVDPMVALRCE